MQGTRRPGMCVRAWRHRQRGFKLSALVYRQAHLTHADDCGRNTVLPLGCAPCLLKPQATLPVVVVHIDGSSPLLEVLLNDLGRSTCGLRRHTNVRVHVTFGRLTGTKKSRTVPSPRFSQRRFLCGLPGTPQHCYPCLLRGMQHSAHANLLELSSMLQPASWSCRRTMHAQPHQQHRRPSKCRPHSQ